MLKDIDNDFAKNVASILGEKPGETFMHEINEAYIGAKDYPGSDWTGSYKLAHRKAAALDRVQSEIQIKGTEFDTFINWSGKLNGESDDQWRFISRQRK